MNKELLSYDSKIIGADHLKVGGFWQWAYSDILSNRNRGIFGEFLVASALGVTKTPRVEWDAFDIVYNDLKIEVKAAAYIQGWKQQKFSVIRFDIAPKQSWFSDTNSYSKLPGRPSDYYVFCLFAEKDSNKVNVLDVSQWEFYILSTKTINDVFGTQKGLSLKKLKQHCPALPYDKIKTYFDHVL